MRSVLLHINDDECLEARLQVALDICRRFGSHLNCVHPILWNLAAPGDIYGLGGVEMIPILKENADALKVRVEARLADEGVAWSWIQEFDSAGSMLLAQAALSDLIVLGARDPIGGNGVSALVGQVAIHSRTPVLVVPASAKGFDAGAPAIVAWNGSAEASRALRAAVPLLKEASAVELITIEDEGSKGVYDLPPTEGGEYLSRHGIECQLVQIPSEGASAAEVLKQAATVRKAGLIVMGAYGHSRMREIVLGGVTRGLLANPPVPLFLSH